MADLEIKNRILQQAREHFFKFGFSKVTMSEIAAELGMSKKTLYAYFPSKEDLLMASLRQLQEETSAVTEGIIADMTMDFGEKMNKLMSVLNAHHSKLDTWFLADLQKNLPSGWSFCNDFQRDRMRKNTRDLVRQGVEQGIFRSDVNETVLVTMYMIIMQGMMTPEMLKQLPLSATQLYDEIMKVLFGGALTNEGREKYLSQPLGKYVEIASEHEMD
ncbi:MAG: TetR/AcrR family transcriptional regulator [Ignavibacteriales bacterium]|nr:TetR/AcrR family transcriptional regulator [Ignavibacteriales bacterium]